MTCPHCRDSKPRLLDAISQDSEVRYYRCEVCGMVWNIPKQDDGPVTVVMPPVTGTHRDEKEGA